jgi:hypothetical protein
MHVIRTVLLSRDMESMDLAEILDIPNQEMPFIEAFNRHQVRYLVIGGTAVRFHGHLRSTNDLDVAVENSKENAHRVYYALNEILGPQLFKVDDLCRPAQKLRPDYYCLDILTSVHGVGFDEAFHDKVTVSASGVSIHIISKFHLICSKKVAAREKDLEDIRALECLRDP